MTARRPALFLPPATRPSPPEQVAPSAASRRIFVSHSSKDHAFGAQMVTRLRDALGAAYEVWYDAMGGSGEDGRWAGGIAPATYWQDHIQQRLMGAGIFVIILSPRAMASAWVAEELALAWSRKNASPSVESGLVVVPVLRETCEAPPWVNLIQRVDFTGWREEGVWPGEDQAWAALLSAIRAPRTRARPLELAGPPFDLAVLPTLDHFIGREDDVARVIALLTTPGPAGQAGLAGVNGLAGIGKTALATEVARRLMGTLDFPDGIAVLDCRDQHGPEAARALLRRALGRFTDGRKEPDGDDLATLSEAARIILSGKRALVIMDNVEADLPAGHIIAALRAAGTAALTTSREPLPAVQPAASVRLDLLPEGEAVALFGQYFGRALNPDETEAARAIVAPLGRHTLATKLAAANAATLGRQLPAIARELANFPDKALLLANAEEAVLWVLESSVNALPSEARALFVALAGFASSDIGRWAALYLASEMGDASADASLQRLLSLRLADSGYLASLPDGDVVDRERVRTHPLVRAYSNDLFEGRRAIAGAPLWSEEQRTRVYTIITEWYAGYTLRAPDLALPPDDASIMAALDQAETLDLDEQLAVMCRGVGGYWLATGRARLGLRWFPVAVSVARRAAEESGDNDIKIFAAQIELFYGRALADTGSNDEAEAAYRRALEQSRALGAQAIEATALNNLGLIEMTRGHTDVAEAYYQQTLPLARRLGARDMEATLYNNIGQVVLMRGRLEEAQGYFERALPILRAIDDPGARSMEATVLNNMGQVAILNGRVDEALDYYNQSLPILHELGDRRVEATVLGNLAEVALTHGWVAGAREYIDQCLPIAREIGARNLESSALAFLGQAEMMAGDVESATAHASESLAMARELDDPRAQAVALHVLGLLAATREDYDAAIAAFQESADILSAMDAHGLESTVLNSMGQAQSLAGRLDDARATFLRCLEIARQVDDKRQQAAALFCLADVADDQQQYDEAQTLTEQSLELARGVGDQGSVAQCLGMLGLLAERRQDPLAAGARYREALGVARAARNNSQQAWMARGIARLLVESGATGGAGSELCALWAEAAAAFDASGDSANADETRELARDHGCSA